MINQNNEFENTQQQFLHAFKDLKIASLLNKAGISKAQGASAFKVFSSYYF